jgi:hypothetical protein
MQTKPMPPKRLLVLLTGLIVGVLPLCAEAQQAAASGGTKVVDCNKARDPQRCQAREAARAACQDKRGAARRQCMEDSMPPTDCSKAPNPARCSAMLAAREACKDKVGPAHRQCMREQAKGIAPAAKP